MTNYLKCVILLYGFSKTCRRPRSLEVTRDKILGQACPGKDK